MASYLNMLIDRLAIIRELLAESGVLYLHIGPDVSHHVRLITDEVFGPDGYLNEIVWKRTPFSGSSKARAKKFPVNHDCVLFYAKRNPGYNFEHIYEATATNIRNVSSIMMIEDHIEKHSSRHIPKQLKSDLKQKDDGSIQYVPELIPHTNSTCMSQKAVR